MLRRGLSAAVLGGTAYATYKYQYDPSVKRTISFAYKIAPLCFDYATTRELPEALHAKWAPEMLRIVLENEGILHQGRTNAMRRRYFARCVRRGA